MKTFLALSTFIVIANFAAMVSAQTKTTTDAQGNTTTTEPSDKYGPGGTHVTISDKKFKLLKEIYKDQCGRVREEYTAAADKSDYDRTEYSDEKGKRVLEVKNGGPLYSGGPYYYSYTPNYHEIGSKEGKALIAKLEKTPCPEGAAGTAGAEKPEKAETHPKARPELPPSLLTPSGASPLFGQPLWWTGPYGGFQFGFAHTSDDVSIKLGGDWNMVPDVRDEIEFRGRHEFDEDGFGLGGCAGYNYEFPNHVVIGAGIAGRKFWNLCDTFETGDFPVGEAGNFDVWSRFRTTGIVTFGPKVGYAWGRFMPYVSGGLAFGELDASQKIFSSTFGIQEVGKDSELRLGWNLAGGLQYALTKNWSLRMEYSYSDLGTFKYPGHSFPDTFHGFGTWHMATLTEHGGNFGFVYTFGGPPPPPP